MSFVTFTRDWVYNYYQLCAWCGLMKTINTIKNCCSCGDQCSRLKLVKRGLKTDLKKFKNFPNFPNRISGFFFGGQGIWNSKSVLHISAPMSLGTPFFRWQTMSTTLHLLRVWTFTIFPPIWSNEDRKYFSAACGSPLFRLVYTFCLCLIVGNKENKSRLLRS